jgi:hypothetical protein
VATIELRAITRAIRQSAAAMISATTIVVAWLP